MGKATFIFSLIAIPCLILSGVACKKKSRGTSEIHPLAKGLISSYNFNGNANDNFGDNDATVNGATLVADRNGKPNAAYSFNGSNNNIIADGSSCYFSNFTYNVWYKPTELPTSGNAYCLMAIGSLNADHNIVLANKYGSADGFSSSSTNNPGTPSSVTFTIPLVYADINNWYMVTLTRDNNNLSLYLNGVLKVANSVSGTQPKYAGSNDLISIGSRRSAMFAKGVIDDVRVYNRALSAEEVAELFKL